MGDEEQKGRALADDKIKENEEEEEEEEDVVVIPATVRFPRSSQRKQPPIPPLKVEVEDKGGPGSQHMWQVYALGGFLIARWLWARWQERRRARGRNEGDDNNNLDGSVNHRPDL